MPATVRATWRTPPAELDLVALEVTGPQFVAFHLEIRADRAFIRGDYREARELSRAVAAMTGTRAPHDLGQAERAALFDRDLAGARADAEALAAHGNHGPAMEVRARGIDAGLAALDRGVPDQVRMAAGRTPYTVPCLSARSSSSVVVRTSYVASSTSAGAGR